MTKKTCPRRDFLRGGAGLLFTGLGGWAKPLPGRPRPWSSASMEVPAKPADVTIRIGTVLVELAPHRIISTVGYNGSVPAPVIRLKEGKPVVVELINETDVPELVHWHGQLIPSEIDGSSEEGTPFVEPHGHRHYVLTPRPAGTRWVHTHVRAGADLHRSMYTGQFGLVLVEPAHDPGRYDREVLLVTHEWEAFFGAEEMEEEEDENEKIDLNARTSQTGKENGLEVGYRLFSINGKALGYGEPVQVRKGERVLFRILNASATENIRLALPGHEFEIVALDGNPVPRPRKVHVLSLGTAERIDAIVEMNQPGVWILGTPEDDDRRRGMGIVVEYAGEKGPPRWVPPPREKWDYTLFGNNLPSSKPDEVIPLVFRKIPGGRKGFNRWTINGKSFPHTETLHVRQGRRYRLILDNRSDDAHPIHLHRHLFELTKVEGKNTSGVVKDTVLVRGFRQVEVDFVADNPGPTLFHCHQQLHMDFGFMTLVKYV